MTYTFETALVFLKQGKKIRRASWTYSLDWMKIIDGKIMIHNYRIYGGVNFEAELTSEDLLAEDWEVLDENGSEMEKKWN